MVWEAEDLGLSVHSVGRGLLGLLRPGRGGTAKSHPFLGLRPTSLWYVTLYSLVSSGSTRGLGSLPTPGSEREGVEGTV